MLTPTVEAIALHDLLLLAQEEAARELTLMESIVANPLTPFVVVFLIFYFMFIGPDRKKKREEAEMRSNLKKNDRIITIGGIHGTVVSVSPDSSNVLVIKIDESGNTRVKINKSAVATVIKDKVATSTSAESK
ncbi:MAG: preprotein translocase subunit YajC [Rubripirellula sp.]